MIDTRRMLPSDAKQTLTEYFLKLLEEHPTCFLTRTDEMRWGVHPFDHLHQEDDYAQSIKWNCWEEAIKQYQDRYPLNWDNDKQVGYRIINGKRKNYR